MAKKDSKQAKPAAAAQAAADEATAVREVVPPVQEPQVTSSGSDTPVSEDIVRVICAISGCGSPQATKQANAITAAERQSLIEAFNNQANPREVLRKALDRVADEKRKVQ